MEYDATFDTHFEEVGLDLLLGRLFLRSLSLVFGLFSLISLVWCLTNWNADLAPAMLVLGVITQALSAWLWHQKRGLSQVFGG